MRAREWKRVAWKRVAWAVATEQNRLSTRMHRASLLWFGGLCLAIAGWGIAALGIAPEAAAVTRVYTVTIVGMRFVPKTITVHRGDRVVWVNKDLVPHTATGQFFDSHSIAANASWSQVVHTAGRYPYICTLHPTMKAILIVE